MNRSYSIPVLIGFTLWLLACLPQPKVNGKFYDQATARNSWWDTQLTRLEQNLLKGQSSQLKAAKLSPAETGYLRAIIARANWLAGLDTSDISPEGVFLLQKASERSLEWNKFLIESSGCEYSAHPGLFNDSVVCYLIPAPDSENVYFGGGIKMTLDKDTLEVLDNVKLHEGIMQLPKEKSGDMMFRSIGPDTMPDEVDIAQCIWYRRFATVQYLKSPRYWFIIRPDAVITKEHIRVFDAPAAK